MARLRSLTGTNQQGSTALGLIEAARQLGFSAKGVKGPPDALPTLPLPAIAHCLIEKKLLHYVVLVRWTPRSARVMDPAVGRIEQWSHAKFISVWTGVLILLAPDTDFQTGDHTVSPARRLWNLLQPHGAVLTQAFVGAVVSTLLALATSIYVQKIVDNVIPDGNRPLLNLLSLAMLLVLGFRLVLGVFQSLLSLRTAQLIDAALILGYYRHLLRLPQPFFDTMRVGEITSRVADAVKIRNFLNTALLNLVLNPLILVFAFGGMFFTSAYQVVLLWLGSGLVLETGLTPGELMSCYTLAGYLTGPITALLGLNSSIQETLVATDRLFEIMDLGPETDRGTIAFGPEHAGDLCLEDVSFKHAGRLGTLHHLSLTLSASRITVIAGPSGCGKSTLLALLQRLYLPEQGRILIGGVDISYFQLASLRRSLAVVPQQTHLLTGTILENLAPGDPQPDLQRLLKLCRDVGALEFIEKLPQGFFTHLTENGANLSGGQRQRLALVRALYLEAPIMLLDEPTSALDGAAEEAFIRLLRVQRDAGKTIIIAAHNTCLIAAADHVVRMEGGGVAD